MYGSEKAKVGKPISEFTCSLAARTTRPQWWADKWPAPEENQYDLRPDKDEPHIEATITFTVNTLWAWMQQDRTTRRQWTRATIAHINNIPLEKGKRDQGLVHAP